MVRGEFGSVLGKSVMFFIPSSFFHHNSADWLQNQPISVACKVKLQHAVKNLSSSSSSSREADETENQQISFSNSVGGSAVFRGWTVKRPAARVWRQVHRHDEGNFSNVFVVRVKPVTNPLALLPPPPPSPCRTSLNLP